MRTEVVSREDALLRLRDAWHQLLEASQADPLFLSHHFATAWWSAYGRALGRLHVACLRDETGELVGIAPCYVTAPGADRPRTLRLLGSGGDTSPDYLNVIARSGCEQAVAAGLASHLRANRGEWDAVLLTDLADDLAITDALEAELRRSAGLVVRRIEGEVCPYAHLAASIDAHRASLPGHLRRLTFQRARLERQHGARFFRWPDAAAAEVGTLAAAMERLAELHRQRFDAKGEAHGFASPAYLGFHQRLAAELHDRGQLRLFGLEVEGRVVAMLYGCRCGERLYHLQGGFDPAWSRAQVGKLLLSYAVEQALDEGARRFDFLKGRHAYKDEWATGRRYTVALVAAPRSLAGAGHLYRQVYRPRLGERWRTLRAAATARRGVGTALLGAEAGRPPRELAMYLAAGVLYHTGLMGAGLRLIRLLDRRSRVLVLAYHRVLPEELRLPGDTMSIGRRHFASQVDVLAKLLRHPDPVAMLAELRRPPAQTRPYAMLVTFDDGHRNVLRHAWPALRRRDVPLVFCVTTGLCGTGAALWSDDVTELVVHAPLPAIHLRVGATEEIHILGSVAERVALAGELKRRMKVMPAEEFTRFLAAVRAACGGAGYRTTERTELCAWDDLELMRREGVVLAAHSHEHRVLSRLSPEALVEDLRRSAAELTRRAGVAPRFFSYPNGLHDDITPAVVDQVRGLGFSHAFTMTCRIAAGDDDALLLPRVAPMDRPGVMIGLSVLRHLATAVARDAWRRWRGRREEPAAPPAAVVAPPLAAVPPSPVEAAQIVAA